MIEPLEWAGRAIQKQYERAEKKKQKAIVMEDWAEAAMADSYQRGLLQALAILDVSDNQSRSRSSHDHH